MQIVGDDLHPIGQVKDFAPYVAKIKASGADSVVTGNWGQDLTLLIKAAKDAGLNVNFYTYYASTSGVPTAMAAGVGGKVRMVAYGHNNMPGRGRRRSRTTSRRSSTTTGTRWPPTTAWRCWPRASRPPRAPTR